MENMKQCTRVNNIVRNNELMHRNACLAQINASKSGFVPNFENVYSMHCICKAFTNLGQTKISIE